MAAAVDTIYVSCSCNRCPHSVDWARNGLICFGAHHAIAIYDPSYADSCRVLATLCHHKGRINSVEWIRHKDGSAETELVSASSDKLAVVWTQRQGHEFHPSAVLEGHQDIVTLASGLYLPSSTNNPIIRPLIVATASVDSTVKLWMRQENEEHLSCIQTMKFGSGLYLCTRFYLLPGTDTPFLACAADDAKIHLFVKSQSEQGMLQFVKMECLVGHEDWVQGIDIVTEDSGDVLLASCSLDTMIRLWRLSPREGGAPQKLVSELKTSEDIQLQEQVFAVGERYYAITLESVLAGHEGWVYGIQWHPAIFSENGSKCHQPMKLLSSSEDKTMIIWAPDIQTGVWLETARMGEVGGNTLGFYGSAYGPDGLRILGHGYQGSLHIWKYLQDTWQPAVTAGGHFDQVVDLQWEPGGEFLLSVSKDQTTRLHAAWHRKESNKEHSQVTWHELARPQVHGYDMACLAILSRYRFVSGAEEKVIRAFEAPHNFVENFHRICRISPEKDKDQGAILDTPCGASVPALGLSNKAVYENEEILPSDRHVKDEYPAAYFVPLELKEPPTEEHLIQNTLWPEVHKLYGHGYELFALAARPDGKLLASACHATVAEHAAIILWNTDNWQQIQTLLSHQLTVTRLTFSPDGVWLLSVSRDRRWCLFQQKREAESGDGAGRYELVASTDKRTGVHSRIIWCCAWTHDSRYFATGSRDGKVVIWHVRVGEPQKTPPLDLKGDSVTALTFSPYNIGDSYLLAIGVECGDILLYKWWPGSETWERCLRLNNLTAHHKTVKRLAFRPHTGPSVLSLASGGADHILKIHNIVVDKL